LDAYWRQRTWKRVLVIGAGPGVNLLFAIFMFALLLVFRPGRGTPTGAAGEAGRRAMQAGLRPGDRVVAINDKPVGYVGMFDEINSSQGRPLQITVIRNGRRVELTPARPLADTDGRYRVGFRPAFESVPFTTAIWESLKLTGMVTKEI